MNDAIKVSGRRGNVLALGKEILSVARSYALRTGRSAVECAPEEAHRRLTGIDVIIGLADDVYDELIQAILSTRRRQMIGLILGADADGLVAKANATAERLAKVPEQIPHRIELRPSWPVGRIDAKSAEIFGATADVGWLRTALARGDTLLTLAGHGDGIDAELAGGVVLCPLDDHFYALKSGSPPSCLLSAACYRHREALTTEKIRDAMISPSAISGRILIWNSCVGWPPHRGFIDRAYGVGMRLAVSPQLGALVTTCQIVISPPEITEPLVAAIFRGVPIGAAVASHNASPLARQYGHRLLLFGDPLYRVAPPVFSGTQVRPPPLPADRKSAAQMAASDIELKQILEAVMRQHPLRGERQEKAWGSLLRRLKASGLEGFWARTSTLVRRLTTVKACPYCGLTTTRVAIETEIPFAHRRYISTCPRCEIISDRPHGLNVIAHIDTNTVRLQGRALSATGVRAALLVRRQWPMEPIEIAWPHGGNGTPEPLMAWQPPDSRAPTAAAVVVWTGRHVAMFARAMRGSCDWTKAAERPQFNADVDFRA